MPYLNPDSYASEPGLITISKNKWKAIAKDSNLNFLEKIDYCLRKKRIAEYIYSGDTQPAIVVSLSPLLIAAYSEDMDGVVMLKFPQSYVEQYNLKLNFRLVTVNTYKQTYYKMIAQDIDVGINYGNNWADVQPIVAQFISDDEEMIAHHVANVPEKVWDYVLALGKKYLQKHPNVFRNGLWFAHNNTGFCEKYNNL